jgi:hypothetical protein
MKGTKTNLNDENQEEEFFNEEGDLDIDEFELD